jgi:hypothetical protein
MKKTICLVAIVLLIGCAGVGPTRMKIAATDLPGLKGTWEGMLGYGLTEVTASPAKLEILTDTVPLRVKLTVDIPDVVASRMGITAGKNIFESDDGVITTQGTVVWTGAAKNFLEISIVGEGKLTAWYFFRGLRGDGTLRKKK